MASGSLSLGVVLGATVSGSFSRAIAVSQNQLTGLGREITHLNKEQTKLQGFSKRNEAVKEALSALNVKKQELALSKQHKSSILAEVGAGRLKGAEAVKALKNVNAEIKRNTQDVAKLDAKYQRIVDDMQRYGEGARKAGFSLVNHEARLKKIGSEIEKNTKKAERYNQIISKKIEIGETIDRLKGGVTTAAATAAPLVVSVKEFSAYEAGMQRIGATAEMSGEQIGRMRQELLSVSEGKGVSHEKLQNALGVMVAGGMDVGFALKIQSTSADLIKAYDVAGEDIGQASLALRDNLGFSAENISRGWDIMSKAGKDGNFEINDMAKAFPSIGASAKALQVGGEKGVASISAMLQIARKGAGDSSEAANNMRNFLDKMVSSKTEKNAQGFGFSMRDLISKAQKEGKNPIEEAVKKLMEVTRGDQAKIADMFDDVQVKNFLRPMMQNWEEYERIRDNALDKSKNVVEKDAADMDQTTQVHLDNMGSAWARFKTKIGEKVAPALNMSVRGLTAFFNLGARIADTKLGGFAIGLGLSAVAASSIAFSMYQIYRIGKLGLGIMGLRRELLALGGSASVFDRIGQVFGGGSWSMRKGGWKKNFTRGGAFGMAGRALGAAGGAYGLYDLWQSDKNAGAKKQSKMQIGESYLRGAMSGAAIGMMFGPVGAVIGGVLGLIYTAVVRHWDRAVSVTKAKFSALKTVVGGYWNQIRQHPIKALAAIGKTILNWSPIGLFYKAFSAVMSYFGVELPSSFTGFGKMILQGLVNGFTSMFPTVTGKIVEIGRAIKARFTGNGAGGQVIQSPSRVWRGFGGYMMEGLDIGLSHRAPAVLSTVSRIGQSIKHRFKPVVAPSADVYQFRASLDAAQEAATSQRAHSEMVGVTNNFNIYQQPGEDADTLARRVVALIERKAGIRERSALADLA